MSEQTVAETTRPAHVKTPGSGILGTHPMRERVVSAILEGKQTTREIAAWCNPPITHVTVARLAQHVKAELNAAQALHKARQMQSVAEIIGANSLTPEQVTKLAVGGNLHLARIQAHQARIDARLENLPADGDVNDLSTLIKTDLQGVRLAAELDGSLSLAGAQTTTNNTFNVIVLPSGDEEEDEVIDVVAEDAR